KSPQKEACGAKPVYRGQSSPERKGRSSGRELLHNTGGVHDAPPLRDLSVLQPPDLDASHLELFSGGGNTEEVAGVGSLEDPALGHGVPRRPEIVVQRAPV